MVMAEQLSEFDFPSKKNGSRYDPYLDGSIWRVTLEDFPGVANLHNVRATMLTRATKKGKKLRTSMPDESSLVVQAYEARSKD